LFGAIGFTILLHMIRCTLLFGILALEFSSPVVADVKCSISDWPLEVPEGPADFVRLIVPGLASGDATPTVRMQKVTRTAGSARAGTSGDTGSRAEPRDWTANRSHSPSESLRLRYAVFDNDLAQVDRLTKSAAVDVNAGHGSLLEIAASEGEPEITHLLITRGARVRSPSGDQPELHLVANAVSGLDGYLNAKDQPDLFFNRPPRSIGGYFAVIRLLLDAGADPNALLAPGETLSALGNLILTRRFEGDVDIARLLVAHGALVDGPPPFRSPLGLALDKGYDDYAAVLLADHQISPATLNQGLAAAIAHESAAMAQTLLDRGADANFGVGRGPILCTTLYSDERRSIALALLTHGANPNADCGGKYNPGSKPLNVANAEDPELIDALIARGGQLGVPAQDAANYQSHGIHPGPLNWALLHHRDYLAATLLARDPLAVEECGAVVYAARYGAAATLAKLFKLGADPNATSERGVSALMAAAFHGQLKALELLLSQPRIDINRTTPRHLNRAFFTIQLEGRQPPPVYGSRTALMYASLGGFPDAVSLLIAHGAQVHQTDAEGIEARQYAHNAAAAAAFTDNANAR
jgi:ankyrin repeat protein